MHKTYPLLRYMPTYAGLPAAVLPLLILATALALAVFGLYGVVPAFLLTIAVRALYTWTPDAFFILRGALSAIPVLDRHWRLRP